MLARRALSRTRFADDFLDHRIPEATINDAAEVEDPTISIVGGLSNLGELEYELPEFEIPKLEVFPPKLLPHDHGEVWIEKSTQNEWLVPLCAKQCVELELPRMPLKETELRAAKFEARYGAGATELDALEALHPGKLEELVKEWINS